MMAIAQCQPDGLAAQIHAHQARVGGKAAYKRGGCVDNLHWLALARPLLKVMSPKSCRPKS